MRVENRLLGFGELGFQRLDAVVGIFRLTGFTGVFAFSAVFHRFRYAVQLGCCRCVAIVLPGVVLGLAHVLNHSNFCHLVSNRDRVCAVKSTMGTIRA